jgi:hypothetical protein
MAPLSQSASFQPALWASMPDMAGALWRNFLAALSGVTFWCHFLVGDSGRQL